MEQYNPSVDQPLRIYIVDDSDMLRKGLHAIIAGEPGMQLVGQAATPTLALSELGRVNPDIVIMDIKFHNDPLLNGIEATYHIASDFPLIKVIVLTSHNNDDGAIYDAFRAGAYGYLEKEVSLEHLVRTLWSVTYNENNNLTPGVAARISSFFRSLAVDPCSTVTVPRLTEFEELLLSYIATGESLKVIAQKTSYSYSHIKNSVVVIKRKLQVADRSQLALRAAQMKSSNP